MPYTNRQSLLSRGELAFHGPLQEAVAGHFLIMCKVRLADIITCSESDWRKGHGGAISQKHIDFVLCVAATTRFVLAIELDDRSHARSERRMRDAFVNRVLLATGVRLLRIQARAAYSAQTIASMIQQSLTANNVGVENLTTDILQHRREGVAALDAHQSLSR